MIGRRRVVAAVVAVATCALAGCAQTSSEGSRAQLFESIDALSAASSIVAVVTVESTETVAGLGGPDPLTLHTVVLDDVLSPGTIGSDLPDDAPRTAAVVGDTITVRQMGGAGSSAPAELLRHGQQYLLFLTPTMLDGPAADDFFVVGVTAGIYAAADDAPVGGPAGEFTHDDTLHGGSGDDLPSTITPADLDGSE